MTGATAPAQTPGLLRRLKGRFLHTSSTGASKTDASASHPIPSKPTSSTPSYARSPSLSSSLNAGSKGRSASLAGQIVHPVQQNNKDAVASNRDFLDSALRLLSDREQETIKKYTLTTTGDIGSALQNAFTAAQEKQKLCEEKKWTFTFRGHMLRLREEADKILQLLDRFKQVGDIVANVDPIHVGLPWAGIRLLLQL
jgi:hypothetical protein